MSAESSDYEQISEWTLVNSIGDDESPSMEAPPTETFQDESHDTGVNSATQLQCVQLESKICEISSKESCGESPVVEELQLNNRSGCASKEGSEASDIERISDDGLTNYPMDASAISRMSTFSLISAPGSRDADLESLGSSSGISVIHDDTDLSAFCSSKDELPSELDIKCVKTYTHTPNPKLNFALNLLLVLSITMVVGLGVGHFIGWSSRWMHQRQLHQSHIAKLKALQEELVDCLQNPASYYLENNGESKACYEKVDYWKKKFEDMLSENHVLQDFVGRNMHKEDPDDDDDDKCEEANKNIEAEYRQLKVHLINQQLENVATLRQVEALKRQEIEFSNRVKLLEEENEELKAQVEEDANDEVSKDDSDDEDKETIMLLSSENQELKRELNDLMATLKLEQEEDEKKTTEKLWPLRQQINQLKNENSELQQVIAKLRYGKPPAEPEQENKASKSKSTRREPPKPDNALHAWLVDNMNELNLTEFVEYLTKIAMDKDAARKELMQLEENLKRSYEQLSEKAKHGIDTGKTLLSDIQKNLHSKLQQIMNVDPLDAALPIEQIRKVGETLTKTVEKMYEIGMDMLNAKTEDGTEYGGKHKLQKQVDKLIGKFGTQWESIKASVWGEKKPADDPDEKKNLDGENVKPYKQKVKEESKKSREENGKKKFGRKDKLMDKKEGKEKETFKEKKTSFDDMKNRKTEENQNGPDNEPLKKDNKNNKGTRKDKEEQKSKKNHKNRNTDENQNDPDNEPLKKASKNNKETRNDKEEQKSKKNHNKRVDKEEKSKTYKKDAKKIKKETVEDIPNQFSDKPSNEEAKENTKNLKEKESVKKHSKDNKKDNKSKKYSKENGKRANEDHWKPNKFNKNSNRKLNTNSTEFSSDNSGDWVFKRADGRTATRNYKQQNDWLFERAKVRENSRRGAQNSEWYFNKNKRSYENEDILSDRSMRHKKDDDKEESDKRSKKKSYKMRKNQKHWSSDEDSDEEEWNEQKYRRHAYHYEYNVDWSVPDPRSYHSS